MVTLAPFLARRLPFYYGWVVVSVVGMVSFGSVAFGPTIIGVVFTSMSDEFGWSRTTISGAILASGASIIVVGPLGGRLIDRYGGRGVSVVAALVMSGCLVGLGFTQNIFMFYILFGLGYAMFMGVTRIALSAVTAQWFVRRRGMAAAVGGGGMALGFVVLPVMASLVMAQWDWRTAWVVTGVVVFIVAVPASLLLLRARPSDVGQLVDGDKTEQAQAVTTRLGRSAATEVQWTLREATRTPTMWLLLLGLTIQGISVNGISIHLIPHLQDQGLTASNAALTFTVGGAVLFFSQFFWGALSDHIHTRYIYALGSLFLMAWMVSLLLTTQGWGVIVVGTLMGIGFGGNITVVRVAYANYFGRRSAGAIQGFVTPPQLLVAGSGALISGIMYDRLGSYTVSFLMFTVLMLVAIAVVMMVPDPKKREAPVPSA